MNENFRKLARCNERIENFMTTGPVQRAAIEEFAELIVKEVLAVQSKLIMVDGVNGYHLERPTKEYFGVE